MTYEPQVNSDVFAMFQSEVEGRIVDWSLLTKDVPPEYHHDLDYLISMLDWDANVNPEFAKTNKMFPRAREAGDGDGSRRLSREVDHLWHRLLLGEGTDRAAEAQRDDQGQRRLWRDSHARSRNVRQAAVATPTMIRFGQMTEDELFVTAAAAKEGVRDRESRAPPIRS